jgi:hypothetical protein
MNLCSFFIHSRLVAGHLSFEWHPKEHNLSGSMFHMMNRAWQLVLAISEWWDRSVSNLRHEEWDTIMTRSL